MKNKMIVIILITSIAFIGIILFINIQNDLIANNTKKELINTQLPNDTKTIDSISVAGKLTGNGNGMQYFGAILIKTDMSKEELENKIATFTGGRAAEEVVFGEVTTGASNDIEQATKIARSMITRYGMSDDFDMVAMETVTNQYLGGDASLACSADTQKEIDRQVVELVKREHEKAKKILLDNRQKLDDLANYLYEKETITGDEFMAILNGNNVQAEAKPETAIEAKEADNNEKTV